MRCKAAKTEAVIENVHKLVGDRQGCLEDNCAIKRKWVRKISFYEKELKNARLLREKIGFCPEEVQGQI